MVIAPLLVPGNFCGRLKFETVSVAIFESKLKAQLFKVAYKLF